MGLILFVPVLCLGAFFNAWLAFRPDEVRDTLDEILHSGDVEEMFEMLDHSGFPEMSRAEIWRRGLAIWRETHVLTASSRNWATFFFLFCFSLLLALFWIKTFFLPRSSDLGVLLSAELFILCQSGRE